MKTFTVDIPENVLDQFRSEQEVKRFIAEAIASQLVQAMSLSLSVTIS